MRLGGSAVWPGARGPAWAFLRPGTAPVGELDRTRIAAVRREVAKPAAVLLVSNLIAASPAMAGNVFDFNLTMPIMMGQFLLLMVFLDKVSRAEQGPRRLRGSLAPAGASTCPIPAADVVRARGEGSG